MASKNNFITSALKLFNIKQTSAGFTPDSINKQNPLKARYQLPNYASINQVWEWFLQETLDTSETLQNRKNRYQDLDFAVKQNTLIKAAVDLFADEAVQCSNCARPVRIKAKKEVQEYIEDLLDCWGITQQQVRETIWNKVLFGDSFEINDIRPNEGIVQVTPITVWDVADRLEFNPSKILEQMRYYNNTSGASTIMKLSVLAGELETEAESESVASFFNRYLLGFEIAGNRMAPPWAVTHYRAFTMLREFSPWGRSRFINILPMFRQLLAAEGLMQVARSVSFPKDVYSVSTRAGAPISEKWAAIETFQEQLDNAGMMEGGKELPSIGSRIIVPKDLVDFNSFKSDIDVDAIADIEYLRDNLIMGLMIPKGYLIVDSGGWGTSGQSLLQQFKPFGRMVFSDQSDYLQGLTEKIKIHLEITGKFEGWNTPFEVEMEFPVIEQASDRLQHKAEELTLANTTLDTLKNILGVEKVPPEIIKDAFGTMTSLPQATIDKYVNALIKANPEAEEDANSSNSNWGWGGGGNESEDISPIDDFKKMSKTFEGTVDRHANQKLSTRESYIRADNRWKERRVRDSLQEEIIRIKAGCRFYEGSGNGKHYLSSLQTTPESKKNFKVLKAFIDDAKSGKGGALRESIVKARENKEDWEKWD